MEVSKAAIGLEGVHAPRDQALACRWPCAFSTRAVGCFRSCARDGSARGPEDLALGFGDDLVLGWIPVEEPVVGHDDDRAEAA